MKRHSAILLSFLLLAGAAISPRASAHKKKNCYKVFKNSNYNCQLLLPCKWKKKIHDLGYKHMIVLSKGSYTEIKITTSKPDKSEQEKWDNWKEWYIKGIGRKMRRIIETKKVIIEKKIVGKVLLFEYIYRGKSVLQRVLIAKFDDIMVTVECRATISSFKKYTETFDTVMGSVRTLSEAE